MSKTWAAILICISIIWVAHCYFRDFNNESFFEKIFGSILNFVGLFADSTDQVYLLELKDSDHQSKGVLAKKFRAKGWKRVWGEEHQYEKVVAYYKQPICKVWPLSLIKIQKKMK